MSFQRNKLRDAIALALVVGATATLSTGAAFAQDAPAPAPAASPTSFDTIVVTGTRIQSQTVTASSPVTEINAEEFQYAGATRIDDLVNQYPQMNPVFDDLQNNPSLGYPTLDLRGLGPQRTLTLVDGNRLPPGAAIFTDISIIPSSLVKRVDILTGGASAVYGSDAIAGVVNFVLDTEFEGVKLDAGISAYRHDNRNDYIGALLDARGFDHPEGDTGFDGVSKNIDIAIGGSFADGAGHAMAWLTWRRNDSLFQSERDYSACALSASGKSCGGSGTNAAGDFFILQPGAFYNETGGTIYSSGSLAGDGSWLNHYGAPFNFAPLNYYQRPDERYTFGASVKYDVNEHFRPYMETMFLSRTSAVELAPSGAFFVPVQIPCSSEFAGSLCDDLGFDPQYGDLTVYVAKRNVEGGNRHTDSETTQFRVVAGAEGGINDNWSYNASVLYGQMISTTTGHNDFLTSRIQQALLGCGDGSFDGCLLYNVWVPGGVTVEAAQALQGVSMNHTVASLTGFNAYVTGDLPWSFPSADGDPLKLVAGVEWRSESYRFDADTNSQEGNFAGSGGPATPLSGTTTVQEVFLESSIPVVKDAGFMKALTFDLGYRYSDYALSGSTNTYKIGFNADMDKVRVRGGFNHAIRAPNVGELFTSQSIALFGGTDGCAGPTPTFTLAQCVNTGLAPGKYGSNSLANLAGQYNQFVGGNPNLTPEKADTWTIGIVLTPIDNLQINLDAYDIKLENTITTIPPGTILKGCAITGNPILCSLIHRSANGDLWRGSDPATSGFITATTNNFGERHFRGIDLATNYHWDALGGRMGVSLQGSYLLLQEVNPLPGVDETQKFDCTGKINVSCGPTPKWRHIANWNYTRDRYTLNLRWRYFGSSKYVNEGGIYDGNVTVDKTLCSPDIDAGLDKNGHPNNAGCIGTAVLAKANYFDLSASVNLGEATQLTFGVNNIADKEPPMVATSNALNGNSPGAGYDQLGRYFFANVEFKW